MTIGPPVYGRVIVCNECGVSVDVLEAATGARTERDHRWIDADTFVCGGCMESAEGTVLSLDENLSPQERADAQVAWAERTGDAIPFQPAVMA